MTTRLLTRSLLPRRPISITSLKPRCAQRAFTNGIIEANDIILLKRINSRNTSDSILSQPLVKGGSIKLSSSKDKLSHDWIIGRGIRETVRSRRGGEYRLQEPTLAEHTDLWERMVTPIYSADAVATLALLDLNPTTPPEDYHPADNNAGSSNHSAAPKLEIFEAGTGHGAFTLNLSRAIHAANTAPSMPFSKEIRRAIIHTLDRSAAYSAHAQNMIRNFRKGLYLHNIDFHVGEIGEFIGQRFRENGGIPFLDHAILDLPGCHEYMEIVASALKPNGSLLVFAPQITQINTCVLHSKKAGTPMFLDTVIELGGAMGVGGREWDVRPIRPRAVLQAIAERELRKGVVREEGEEVGVATEAVESLAGNEEDGWEMVCRPKVGGRVQGGGFVGQWRKMVPQRSFAERHLELESTVGTVATVDGDLSEVSSTSDEEVTAELIDESEISPPRPVTE